MGITPEIATPTVRGLTAAEVQELRANYNPRGVNLGGHHNAAAAAAEIAVNAIQGAQKEGCIAFLIEWTGNKIPRGASINGVQIGWTQHGIVTGTKGEDLGLYERLVECGGPRGTEQKMLVFANNKGT